MPLLCPHGVHHTVASVTAMNEPALPTEQQLITLMIQKITENEIVTILPSQQHRPEKVKPFKTGHPHTTSNAWLHDSTRVHTGLGWAGIKSGRSCRKDQQGVLKVP